MDAVDCNVTSAKTNRVRYGRDIILAIKEHARVTDINVDDALFRVNAVAQRSGRGKSKCPQSKTSSDRSRDTGGIVLGPQKRAWNTGCHVSYAAGREVTDGTFTRGGKLSSDYRPKDRQLNRQSGEFKHELRGALRVGVRRNEGGSFGRGRFRDDRHGERQGPYEEEPEWFSEGPTTVNETIELGRVLEADEGDSLIGTKVSTPISPAAVPNGETLESKPENGSADQRKTVETGSPQSSLSSNPQSICNNEPHGSRFRHLFPKMDTVEEKKTSAINDQLLELLRGSSGPSTSNPDRHNVLQVENKLRSLLLGHSVAGNSDTAHSKPGAKDTPAPLSEPKPKILTVEEIEAQLNLSCNTQPTTSENSTDLKRLGTDQSLAASSQMQTQSRSTASSTIATACTPNLAPVLHSLALRQQQHTVCTKPAHLHNPLGPFGILSNSMVRLPSSTNAMSASARINQLQHPDTGLIDPVPVAMTHPWDTSSVVGANMLQSNPMNPALQRGLGVPPGLNDLGCRSTNVTISPNINALIAPRRPIVKAQQTTATQQPTPQMAINNTNGPTDFGAYVNHVDRRTFNLPTKPHFSTVAETFSSGDKPQLGGLFSASTSNFCPVNMGAPHFVQGMNSLVAGNNSSGHFPIRLRATKPQSENTLAFLSQLVEMDRSSISSLGTSKASALSHLMTAGLKTKTLEEIEH